MSDGQSAEVLRYETQVQIISTTYYYVPTVIMITIITIVVLCVPRWITCVYYNDKHDQSVYANYKWIFNTGKYSVNSKPT